MAETRLGELRWLVWIMTRQQAAEVGGTGITETPANVGQVHAKIEQLRPVTFYAARQTDMPVTHMITVRWLDYIDNTHAFVARPGGQLMAQSAPRFFGCGG